MKKSTVFLMVLLLSVGLFIGILRLRSNPPSQSSPTQPSFVFKKACDVFTVNDAQSVLGNGSKKGADAQTDVIAADHAITTCTYAYDPGSLSDLVTASILLRGSTSANAKQSFESAKPDDAISISGLGEAAYWSPATSQLNMLKGSYWLSVNTADQDIAHKIAAVVSGRL